SYNANPASMRAAPATLASENVTGRRIAVLGAMRELGEDSDDYHIALAGPIQAAGIDCAVLVGEEMEPLAKALGPIAKMTHVPDAASAIDALRGRIRPGDAVVVKGSNAIGLAALVEALASGKS
ncbi:MAG: glutamate ligase domain-containing protein, partial [Sphingomonadales bacterium]